MGAKREDIVGFVLAESGSTKKDARRSCLSWERDPGSTGKTKEKDENGLLLLTTLTAFSLQRDNAR